jgi:hypothetical protein
MFKQGRRTAYLLLAVAMMLSPTADQSARAVSSLTLNGAAASVLRLSAGTTDGGMTASMKNGEATGAQASGGALDSENATTTLDFGDLARGDGRLITGSMALRIRSNCRYKITMSRVNFVASNLQVAGTDVSGTADGGSFIRVTAGPSPKATGADANAHGCVVVSELTGTGVPLSQIQSGAVTASSSVVARGEPASLRGSFASSGNAVDLPINFSCPSGMQIGPVRGGTGTFQATVQFEIFPER